MRTRRAVQITLGLLWLLDGVLQLQAFMFTRGFADAVIAPAADGQPGFVTAPVHFAARLIRAQPVALNALFAATQLLIGAGLLIPRAARLALAASIGWSISVWWLGEGLGGLASGHALMLTGAPGAVLCYVIAALAGWPSRAPGPATAGTRGPLTVRYRSDIAPPAWIFWVWALLWLGAGVLQLLPGNALSAALNQAAGSIPDYLAGATLTLADAAGRAGTASTIALAAVQGVIGLAALPSRTRRPAAYAGIAVSLAYWVFGQGLGQLTTGQATDPGTAPLVILLATVLLGAARAQATPQARAREPLTAQYQPNRPA